MASVFTKIINGEIPSYQVAENEDFIAFLDMSPVKMGHTLVVPKKELDYIFDHEDDLLKDLIVFSKHVSKAIQNVVDCNRIGLSVIGLEVPHTHVHLIPICELGDMSFGSERPKVSEGDMQNMAAEISASYLQLQEGEDYLDYLALILIYTANTSDGISDVELAHISGKVGPSHLKKAKQFFDQHSEVEVIEYIDEYSNQFARDNRDKVIDDIIEIIEADRIDAAAQGNILRILKKIL